MITGLKPPAEEAFAELGGPAVADAADLGDVVKLLFLGGGGLEEFEGAGYQQRIVEVGEEADQFAIFRPRSGGEAGAQFLAGETGEVGSGVTLAQETELNDAVLEQSMVLVEIGEGESGQGAEKVGLGIWWAGAGQGEEGVEGEGGLGF